MKSQKNVFNSIDKLIEAAPDMQHAYREFLSLSSPVIKKELKQPGEGSYAIWNMDKTADGECIWKIRDNLTLREKHSWKIQELSSKRKDLNCKRILLFGGSAAASFGYWGEFSIASAIEHALNSQGEEKYEVIDLACVNALWENCIETFHHSLSLKPDMVLFFAGNNEAKTLIRRLRGRQLSYLPSSNGALFLETLEPKEMVSVLNACYEEHMSFEAERTIKMAKDAEVDIHFVIPAFNLSDWVGPEKIPFNLHGAQLNAWLELKTKARKQAENKAYEELIVSCNQLTHLDGGLCQWPFLQKANALEAMGDYSEAQHYYELARDSGLAPFIKGNPQITEKARGALRKTYAKHEISYTDLATLTEQDQLAGRNYFIDYCHLNHSGITLLSNAVVGKIIQTLSVKNQKESALIELEQANYSRNGHSESNDLSFAPLPISNEEIGLGAWVAAIHNYHHGQPKEIVRYWLEKSLENFPELDKILVFLSDHLCAPWRDRFSLGWFKKQGYFDLLGEKQFFFFAKFFYHARFDHALVEIIREIRSDERPQNFPDLIDDMNGDLYQLFFMDMRNGFQSDNRNAARGGWEQKCLEIDVSANASIIHFPLTKLVNATLKMELSGTSHFFNPNECASCIVTLNGNVLGKINIAAKRKTLELKIDKALFKEGINELQFNWSELASAVDQEHAYQRVNHFEMHGLYPTVARVHSIQLFNTKNTIQ